MELILVALLVALLSVRAVGGNVRRGRAWAVLSLAVALLVLHAALPWVWAWPLGELGAVALSCAFLGALGGVLLLPVCERLGVALLRGNARVGLISEDEVRSQLHISAAAQEARALRQGGMAVEAEAIAARVQAAFLLPKEIAGQLARDVVKVT